MDPAADAANTLRLRPGLLLRLPRPSLESLQLQIEHSLRFPHLERTVEFDFELNGLVARGQTTRLATSQTVRQTREVSRF